jgi:hypothetical protein
LREYVDSLADVNIHNITQGEGGIENKNALFKKMKKKKVWKAAAKGVASGLIVGGTIQEIGALFDGNQEGLLENLVSPSPAYGAETAQSAVLAERLTSAEYVRRWLMGELPPRLDLNHLHTVVINGRSISLPEGADLIKNSDGTASLMRGKELLAENLHFNKDGSLTKEAQAALMNKDVLVNSHGAASAQEMLAANKASTHQVHRVLWYDNDTPKPIFDKNELKLWWGGNQGTGIDAQGNYVFNIKHMAPDGSYHKNFSVDAQKAMASGKLKMLLSLSRDTQNHVFEVSIDANGNAIIDPESEMGKMLFANENGKAVFRGKFAEVAQMMGEKNNVEQARILATHPGSGFKGNPFTVMDVPAPYEVDPPPVIPILGRRPLEPARRQRKTGDIDYYGYGYGAEGDFGLLPRGEYTNRMSPELRKDKNLDLSKDDLAVVQDYIDRQDPEYLDELREMIKDVPSMDSNTKVVITIPSGLEGKNMEKTIRNYAKLKNRESFELVIFENHAKDKKRDETPQVIEKMRQEFPDLKIVHLYKEFDERLPIGGLRKYLVDSVMLRKLEAGIDDSLVIASNDADLEGINPEYANILAKKFSEKPELDAVGCKWDYPPLAFEKYPLLHVSQRLWHYFDIYFRHYGAGGSPELIGRNSAFRSGTYAAIGGYNPRATLAEDLEIGWMIKSARNYDSKRISYLNGAWLLSNPRRAFIKILSGEPIVNQYGDFHVNEEIRKASMDELLNVDRDFSEDEFKKQVQALYDFYARFKRSKPGGWADDADVDKSFDRAMRSLGVEYIKRGDSIEIVNIGKMLAGIEHYKDKKHKE